MNVVLQYFGIHRNSKYVREKDIDVIYIVKKFLELNIMDSVYRAI